MVQMNYITQMVMIGVHCTGKVNGNDKGSGYREIYIDVLQSFSIFKQKIMLFVKKMICILYTG